METVTIKIQPKREKKKEAVLRSRQMDDTSGLAFQSVSLTLTEKKTDTNKGKPIGIPLLLFWFMNDLSTDGRCSSRLHYIKKIYVVIRCLETFRSV